MRRDQPTLRFNSLIIFSFFAIITVLATNLYIQSKEFLLKIAWGGFSPIFYVYSKSNPDQFIKDFPSGIENYDKSLLMKTYSILYEYFEILPEHAIFGFLSFEMLLLIFAVFFLSITILKKNQIFTATLCCLLMISSSIRAMDLARFGFPFIGQFYVPADALRIISFTLLIRKKIACSFLTMALVFCIHPTIGLIGWILLGTMTIVYGKRLLNAKSIFAFFLSATAMIGWTLYNNSIASISGDLVDSQTWVLWSKVFNFHWFPVDMGLFTFAHTQRFISFLSIGMVGWYCFLNTNMNERHKQIFKFGFLGSLTLTLLGILLSVFFPQPFLMKIALHRSSDFLNTFLAFFCCAYFCNIVAKTPLEPTRKKIIELFFLSSLMVSPFFFNPGFFLLSAVSLISFLYIQNKRDIPAISQFLVAFSALLILAYNFSGQIKPLSTNAYTAFNALEVWLGAVVISIGCLALRTHKDRRVFFILSVFTASALNWQLQRRLPSEKVQRASAYMEVQKWAEKNTEPTALFMVDPTIHYGWRDFSKRSSFGNIREWLHARWLYNSKLKNFEEGLSRFNTLGIPIDPYLNMTPKMKGYFDLLEVVRKKYYNFNNSLHERIKLEHQIDFFVFNKKHIKSALDLQIIYENSHFIVTK